MATPSHQLYPSPLRYPGGKGKLANYIKLLMVENDLVGAEYVEPYAGGAAVALSLLFEEYASHIHINDLNRGVAAFWRSVLDETDELCKRIEAAVPSVAEWDHQRAIMRTPGASDIDLGYATFFMNRVNRSGIVSGGIIGGRKQVGKWLIDARWRPSDAVDRIRKISRFRSRITVTQLDTAKYLTDVLPDLDDAFVYLDPPYYEKGRRLYDDFYEPTDHAAVAQAVQTLQTPWIVSYDAAEPIRELYRAAPQISYGLRYTARERMIGSEVMFFSDRLLIPDADSPAQVSAEMVGAALARAGG